MKYIIRRFLLVSVFFIGIGTYSAYWSFKLMDMQTTDALANNSVDWRFGFAGMVLLGIAICSIAIGVLINFPKAMRKLEDWQSR